MRPILLLFAIAVVACNSETPNQSAATDANTPDAQADADGPDGGPSDPFYKVADNDVHYRFIGKTEYFEGWCAGKKNCDAFVIEVVSAKAGRLSFEIWDRGLPARSWDTTTQRFEENKAPQPTKELFPGVTSRRIQSSSLVLKAGEAAKIGFAIGGLTAPDVLDNYVTPLIGADGTAKIRKSHNGIEDKNVVLTHSFTKTDTLGTSSSTTLNRYGIKYAQVDRQMLLIGGGIEEAFTKIPFGGRFCVGCRFWDVPSGQGTGCSDRGINIADANITEWPHPAWSYFINLEE